MDIPVTYRSLAWATAKRAEQRRVLRPEQVEELEKLLDEGE